MNNRNPIELRSTVLFCNIMCHPLRSVPTSRIGTHFKNCLHSWPLQRWYQDFPGGGGGRQLQRWMWKASLLFGQFSPKNCMKLKEIRSGGGGRVLGAPRSANVLFNSACVTESLSWKPCMDVFWNWVDSKLVLQRLYRLQNDNYFTWLSPRIYPKWMCNI